MIDFFKSNNEDQIYEQLADKLRDATDENRLVLKKKTRSLKRGYWTLSLTMVLLALFGIVFVIEKWHNVQ